MNTVNSPRFGKLECVVGVFTTLILMGIFALMIPSLRSFIASGVSAVNGAQENPPAAQRHVARVAKANNQSQPTPAPTPSPATDTHSEAQEAPTPARVGLPGQPRPPVGDGTWSLNELIGKTVLAAALLFAFVIGTAMIFVRYLFALLRRHRGRFGPLIHIEYAGAPPVVLGPFTASALAATAPTQETGLEYRERFGATRTGSPDAPTATPFDLGPSFEAQRQAKEDQGQRLHEAVLQQLFEDNLKLHGQIGLVQEQNQVAVT